MYIRTYMYVHNLYVYTYIHVHTYTHTSTPNVSKMCMYTCTFGVTGTVSTYRGSKWVFFISRVPYTHKSTGSVRTHIQTHTQRERERGSQMGTSVVSIVKSGQATNYHFQLPCCYACVHIQCCHFNTYTPYVKHSTLNFHYLVRCVACVHSCGKRQCIGMLLKCIFTAGARERGGLSLAVLWDTEIWVLC